MVPNDIVDAFVLILLDSLRNFPSQFKQSVIITRPMALAMSNRPNSEDVLNKLLVPIFNEYTTVNIVLMPIILYKHYHLHILDKEQWEYHHYSSLMSTIYDKDASQWLLLKLI